MTKVKGGQVPHSNQAVTECNHCNIHVILICVEKLGKVIVHSHLLKDWAEFSCIKH